MSTEDTINGVKYGTVFFERSVSDGNYGNTKAGVYVPFEFATPDGRTDLSVNVAKAFEDAKAHVLNELGIEVKYGDNGVIDVSTAVQNVKSAFPGTSDVPSSAPPAPSAPSQPQAAGGTIRIAKQTSPEPEWFQSQARKALEKKGVATDDFWDNRETKKGNQPWFKGVKTGVGVWPPKGHPDENTSGEF